MIAQWRRYDHSNLFSTALDCGMDAPHFLYHMIIGNMPLFSSIVCIVEETKTGIESCADFFPRERTSVN